MCWVEGNVGKDTQAFRKPNSLRNWSEERTSFLIKAMQNDRGNYRYEIVYHRLKMNWPRVYSGWRWTHPLEEPFWSRGQSRSAEAFAHCCWVDVIGTERSSLKTVQSPMGAAQTWLSEACDLWAWAGELLDVILLSTMKCFFYVQKRDHTLVYCPHSQ